MIKQYYDPELLGVLPVWVVPAIAAGTTIATTIATIAAAKKAAKRRAKEGKSSKAHELRLIELQRQQTALRVANKKAGTNKMLMVGIPAALGAAALLMGE
jgi:hypothetical protein